MNTLAVSVEPMSNAHRRGAWKCSPTSGTPNSTSGTPTTFGPVTLPEAGATVELTPRNLNLYRRWITVYEGHDLVESPDGQVTLDESQPRRTFGMDGIG